MSFKVMFVISGLERGGAENQLTLLANGLADRGWKATVLSYLPLASSTHASEMRVGGVTTLTLNAGSGLRRYVSPVRAAGMVGRFDPDVLVGFMFHGIMTARIVGRLCRVPINVSAIRNERDSRFREWVLGMTDYLTNAVTIMSPKLAADLAVRKITRSFHTHVIPNAVDIARFDVGDGRHQARESLGVTKDQFLWLAAGRLTRQKDYPNLLHAFSALSRRYPDARLMIAGDGPLRSGLSSLVGRLELTDRVRFLGLRPDMPFLYSASDAFVLSSAWEGMPGVILEAMTSRTPVVATSVGAVPELITENGGALSAPPGKPSALADAMERMMELPEDIRKEIGERGYTRVRAEFSRDRVVDKWENLLTTLIRKASATQATLSDR